VTQHYEDVLIGGISVLTVFDPFAERWTTTIIGGPIDGYSRTYRQDDDPAAQHAKAIEVAKEAAAHASNSDAGAAGLAGDR